MSFKPLGYPVEETFDALKAALKDNNCTILEAPPGAGKTTLVPLCLLDQDWLAGQKIIMLEPRRLAARMAASRMAQILDEEVGQTVGYRIRQDKKVGPGTRIEVVTEGVLTRQLQSDPELNGVGLVIFDEFHERNLQGDLGLAFCLESQDALRDDLRLLVMSATLEGDRLADFLGEAPRITSQGRSYNVEIRNQPRPEKADLVAQTVRTVMQALAEEEGSILVFLPGEGEIRRCANLLEERVSAKKDILIAPLYGALSQNDQDIAIKPAGGGMRKVVLATTIAETSLTIEGIRIVVDSGYKRVPRFDPVRAMSGLETVRVSRAAAKQRCGRAGRLEEGLCYQLWPAPETQALSERDAPEILHCDLAPFVLELANWGVKSPHDLRLLDYPIDSSYEQALALLKQLGALDDAARLTGHGKEMMRLGLHPRLAHMVIKATSQSLKDGMLACQIAAALQDGPLIKGRRECDLRSDISLLQNDAGKVQGVNHAALKRARQSVKTLCHKLGLKGAACGYLETGRLLALAYPDRIAKKRSNAGGVYHLSSGQGAALASDDALSTQPYLVVAEMGGRQNQARIFSAAPLDLADIESDFGDLISESDQIGWDKRNQSVQAERVRKLGQLVLKRTPIKTLDPATVAQGMCEGIRQLGLSILPWSDETLSLCQRVEFLRAHNGDWPDFSEDGLLAHLEDWLLPFLNGCSRVDHLKQVDLAGALISRLEWKKQQELDQLAPTHYPVPSGSMIRLNYENPQKAVLSVKLQEMFGEPQTPTVNQGKCRLLIHLLSPAGRPLQVTEDLASFWANSYDSVKKEMRGRYPKHPWPDDPLEAVATRKTKRNLV